MDYVYSFHFYSSLGSCSIAVPDFFLSDDLVNDFSDTVAIAYIFLYLGSFSDFYKEYSIVAVDVLFGSEVIFHLDF